MEKQTNRKNYGPYIEGTAVRKAAYTQQQQAAPRNYVDNERISVTKNVYRNREKASYMTLPYVMMLAVCSIAVLFTCVQYLSLQESIATRKSSIITLESNMNSVKSRNDAIDYSINSYMDVENIERVAKEELGMVRPEAGQVSFYESSQYEYMKQFKDVPVE